MPLLCLKCFHVSFKMFPLGTRSRKALPATSEPLPVLLVIPFPWKETWLATSSSLGLCSNIISSAVLLWQASWKSCPCLSPTPTPLWYSQSPFAGCFIPTALITIWHSICFTYFIVYCRYSINPREQEFLSILFTAASSVPRRMFSTGWIFTYKYLAVPLTNAFNYLWDANNFVAVFFT